MTTLQVAMGVGVKNTFFRPSFFFNFVFFFFFFFSSFNSGFLGFFWFKLILINYLQAYNIPNPKASKLGKKNWKTEMVHRKARPPLRKTLYSMYLGPSNSMIYFILKLNHMLYKRQTSNVFNVSVQSILNGFSTSKISINFGENCQNTTCIKLDL